MTENTNSIIEWLNPSFKETILKYFSMQELKNAVEKNKVSINSITEKLQTENDKTPSFYHKYELIQDWHYAYIRKTMIYKGKEWETYDQAKIKTYMIPSQYQHLEHSKILKTLLEQKFKWFKKFKWEIYNPDDSAYIFLENSEGKNSIYLNLDSLFNFSKEKIIEFNWKFHKHYYDEPAKNEYYEHNKNACAIQQQKINDMFETHIAKKFFNILKMELNKNG